MELNGAVAVVTGATGGIGRAVARGLAGRGAKLVLAGRREDELAALERELAAAEPLAVPGDLTREADAERLVRLAVERHGRLDLLVHAAGAGLLKPCLDVSEQEFDRQLAVNLKAAFLTFRHASAAMRGAGGTIVAIPGVLGRAPMASAAAYCASKYGLVGLVKSMAIDLKRSNVRFALLFLGGVDTPFWDNPDVTLKVKRDVLLSADTAARAALFAAEQAAPGVVGEVVIQPESHQLL